MKKKLFAFYTECQVTNDTRGLSQGEKGLFTSQWEQCVNEKKKSTEKHEE